jgi:hypothetical protein
MTANELFSSVATLSHAEKFRLVQFVLQQLAEEEGLSGRPAPSPADDFDPRRYFGVAHQTRQALDDYLASAREGWN